ncbi:hypothetical protein BJ912DRAFT_965520 [Pholiota molesta]|nr:hypothetical protein BJ912DRAFT_965520 [Pholiota molesta]
MKVAVTGASGVLGSAVLKAFQAKEGINVVGLANSRAGEGLQKLDLTNEEDVEAFVAKFKPNWVIHCAAERRPDVAEKDPEAAQRLNADVPGLLASLSKKLKFKLVYISTDYLYGKSKRDGELAVLGVDGAHVIVLRVPVLYGPTLKNSDSAINILLDVVQDQSGKTYKMDHYATRYPTNVVDIANFLVRLTDIKDTIPPILHYSGDEPYTKYEICLTFAKILGLPHKHIIPDAEPPTGAGATTRPRNCQLYTKETEDLVEGGLGLSLFEEWWNEALKK